MSKPEPVYIGTCGAEAAQAADAACESGYFAKGAIKRFRLIEGTPLPCVPRRKAASVVVQTAAPAQERVLGPTELESLVPLEDPVVQEPTLTEEPGLAQEPGTAEDLEPVTKVTKPKGGKQSKK